MGRGIERARSPPIPQLCHNLHVHGLQSTSQLPKLAVNFKKILHLLEIQNYSEAPHYFRFIFPFQEVFLLRQKKYSCIKYMTATVLKHDKNYVWWILLSGESAPSKWLLCFLQVACFPVSACLSFTNWSLVSNLYGLLHTVYVAVWQLVVWWRETFERLFKL